MPLDNILERHWLDLRFYERAHWYLKFSWLPRKCDRTGQTIWLERAYMGVQMITGPDTPVFEYRWVKKNQWLLEKLKGNI